MEGGAKRTGLYSQPIACEVPVIPVLNIKWLKWILYYSQTPNEY